MRVIRPDEAQRRRTHKPEEISWQCIICIDEKQLAAGDKQETKETVYFLNENLGHHTAGRAAAVYFNHRYFGGNNFAITHQFRKLVWI